MKNSLVTRILLSFALLVFVPAAITAQVTWEDYLRAEMFLPWNASKLVFETQVVPHWIKNGNRFWYRNDTRKGREFVLVDPDRNTIRSAFDHVRLAAALSRVAGVSYAPNKLPFDAFDFVHGDKAIQFNIGNDLWICDLGTSECTRTKVPDRGLEGELLSPDRRWAAFIRDHNLFIRSTETQEEIRLTSDGEQYYDYATSPESRTTAVTDRLSGTKLPPVAIWSPDSKKLVTHRLDQRKVGELHLLQSVLSNDQARPLVHSYRYPCPGDKNVPLSELVIFDLEKRKTVYIDSEPLLILLVSPIESQFVWWSEDSNLIYFIQEERGYGALQLRVADAQTGETRMILEEHGPTYVELNLVFWAKPNVRVLSRGSEIIWFSERDGLAHLYLYDGNTGKLKNRITSGNVVVRDIFYVDETRRWVYFTGCGREKDRDPYLKHLYRAGLDGSDLELLTPENADHEVTFSPTGLYFVDTYSRLDSTPVSVLRRSTGKLVRMLEEADFESLLKTGWKWPEPFTVKARDGVTDIYGAIFRPSTFDPAKKYPVIEAIYPGPQMIRTPKSFPLEQDAGFGYWDPISLAQLGFIVVTMDGLGTPFRSKAFHDVSYGKLEEAGGLEDHMAGLKQLAIRYPWMDLSRVGIYGHSAGGFASTRAMLAYPDFYKVAVASAGNHDQRINIALWGEKYQGLPNGDNYRDQANAVLAQNLNGKLLLVYGDMDDNVHPAMTLRLIEALIKANKDFELLVLPNRSHSFASDPYLIRKRWDYFVEHLLSAKPPKGFNIRRLE